MLNRNDLDETMTMLTGIGDRCFPMTYCNTGIRFKTTQSTTPGNPHFVFSS